MRLATVFRPFQSHLTFFAILAFVSPTITHAQEFQVLDIPRRDSYISIPSEQGFDPAPNKVFLVSFYLWIDKLPDLGKRQTIISKVDDSDASTGWEFALHAFKTGVRPAVYWGSDFRKDWYTYDRLNIHPKRWYSIVIVAKPGAYLDVFGNEVSTPAALERHEVQFLGGYQLVDTRAPSSNANLFIGASTRSPNSFRGRLASILVARSERLAKLDTFEAIRENVTGGSSKVVEALPSSEVELYLYSGRDESRFHREIELVGQASWEPIAGAANRAPADDS